MTPTAKEKFCYCISYLQISSAVKVVISIKALKGGYIMKQKKSDKRLTNAITAALFAAIITVITAYIMHIPAGNGYIHIGDAFIFLCASMLPTPYAAVAAAIGAGLADALTAPMWTIPTVIIKTLIVFFFTSKKEKIINARNLSALLPSLIITCGGYYLADKILFGTWGAFAAVLPNVIQTGASAVVYIVLGLALDSAGFKRKFLK